MFTYRSLNKCRDESSSNSIFQMVTLMLKSKSSQISLQEENLTITSTILVCAKLRNPSEASSVFVVLAHYLTCIIFHQPFPPLCSNENSIPIQHKLPLQQRPVAAINFFHQFKQSNKKGQLPFFFFSLAATTFSRAANKNLNWKENLHLSAALSPWLLYFILQGRNKCQPFQKQLSPHFTNREAIKVCFIYHLNVNIFKSSPIPSHTFPKQYHTTDAVTQLLKRYYSRYCLTTQFESIFSRLLYNLQSDISKRLARVSCCTPTKATLAYFVIKVKLIIEGTHKHSCWHASVRHRASCFKVYKVYPSLHF